MSWYCYLEGKITFLFRARCVAANAVSLTTGWRRVIASDLRTAAESSRPLPRFALLAALRRTPKSLARSAAGFTIVARAVHEERRELNHDYNRAARRAIEPNPRISGAQPSFRDQSSLLTEDEGRNWSNAPDVCIGRRPM